MKLSLLQKSMAAAALLSALPCLAITCDELSNEVDAKIRSGGVAQFSLSVVDANASAPGKVVGSCELGTKKLLYSVGEASDGGVPPSMPSSPPTARNETMLTECKDGSVSVGGNCQK